MNNFRYLLKALALLALPIVLAGCAGQSESAKPAKPVLGVECLAAEQLVYHIHPRLALFKEGKAVTISANIGIVPGKCLYWIHTHTPDGIIHIESPKQQDYTLANFLAIWGKPATQTSIAGMSIGSGQSVRVTVDGAPFSGDINSIVLKDKRDIVIQVGPPFTATPSP